MHFENIKTTACYSFNGYLMTTKYKHNFRALKHIALQMLLICVDNVKSLLHYKFINNSNFIL